ncbi:MAG: OsmC family protein, partial [Myxococcota bacterium]
DKAAPEGLTDIRERLTVETDADDEKLALLLKLTERYCVVLQSLKTSPETRATIERPS